MSKEVWDQREDAYAARKLRERFPQLRCQCPRPCALHSLHYRAEFTCPACGEITNSDLAFHECSDGTHIRKRGQRKTPIQILGEAILLACPNGGDSWRVEKLVNEAIKLEQHEQRSKAG